MTNSDKLRNARRLLLKTFTFELLNPHLGYKIVEQQVEIIT